MSTDTLLSPPSLAAAPCPSPPAVQATGVHKSYRRGPVAVPVLRGVDLTVHPGELLSIVGQSGSGKSTLLHLVAALDVPDRGRIELQGQRWDRLTPRERDRRRNRHVGIIFQFYHLLPELTAWENVLLPQAIGQGPLAFLANRRTLKAEAWGLLERVGMSHRAQHRPRELSGGEMQRVAVARALMSRPRLLLADEPTGNLDRQTGIGIMKLLRDLNAEAQLTIILVTHDRALAEQCDRCVELVEGCVKGD